MINIIKIIEYRNNKPSGLLFFFCQVARGNSVDYHSSLRSTGLIIVTTPVRRGRYFPSQNLSEVKPKILTVNSPIYKIKFCSTNIRLTSYSLIINHN